MPALLRYGRTSRSSVRLLSSQTNSMSSPVNSNVAFPKVQARETEHGRLRGIVVHQTGRCLMPNGGKCGRQNDQVNRSNDACGGPPSRSTERSAAEFSARAVQRLSVLGEMTGGIAHDFR